MLKVMALGDSLTAGGGIGSHVSYRQALLQLLGQNGYRVDFVGSEADPALTDDPQNEGHGGFTIGPDRSRYCVVNPAGVEACNAQKFNLADNVGGWLDSARPDVVLLLIGVNDMLPQIVAAGASGVVRPVKPDEAADKLVDLVSQIRSSRPGVRVVVAALVPSPLDKGWPNSVRLRRAGLRLASEDRSGRTAFADMSQLSLGPEDYFDTIHLTEMGASKVARVWFEAMLPVLNTVPITATPAPTTLRQPTTPKRG